jgi:type I restriction enzyme M protein
MDGRKFAIRSNNKYSLVVANPPFDKVDVINEFPAVYNGNDRLLCSSRLEIEMLYANLMLVEQHGVLLIIMPISFIFAERHKKHREYLAKKYYIKRILKLPDDTFGSSRIKTCAMVICNELSSCKLTEYCEVVCDGLNNYKIINSKSLLLTNEDWMKKKTNHEVAYNLKRGNISSNQFSSKGKVVLHTAGESKNWAPTKRFTKAIVPNPVYAESGDIIVSRVGRSAGSFYLYKGKRVMISDCLYCLKDPTGIIVNTIMNKKYDSIIEGVSTPYITMSDFTEWISSLL